MKLKFKNYKILSIKNDFSIHSLLLTDDLIYNNTRLKNAYIIGYSISNDWVIYNELKHLFNHIFNVLYNICNENYYEGNVSYININKKNLTIYDLMAEDDNDIYCNIDPISFLQLSLINMEANYFIKKKYTQNWNVPMKWIEQQWKLIEEYEKNNK